MQYELFYLVGASKEAQLEEIKKETEEIVEKAGGVFSEKTTVEKRRLSYEVRHETHGIYVARRFELEDGEAIQKITKKLNLNGNVLRFIISRAQDLPPLKSKEERMADQAQTNTGGTRANADNKNRKAKKETKEVEKIKEKETAEVKEEEIEAGKKDKKAKDEDIDKRLEEILNI